MPSRRALVLTSSAIALASAGWARRDIVGHDETTVFQALNGAPDALHRPVWLVMQGGSLGAVAVVSGALRQRGRTRTAGLAMLTGTAVWSGVKLIKPLVGRRRPSAYVESTRVRGEEQSGLGYPSGHAAVAMTLALVATEGCPVAVRRSAVGIALTVGLARVYVGAHLPLDVVGGWALGAVVGLTTAGST